MWQFLLVALAAAISVGPPAAWGQHPLEQVCDRQEVQRIGARDACLAAAQAAVSAQPALGILIASGNPTLGTAGAAGLRLGFLPRVSAGVRLNVVHVEIPDLLAESVPGRAGDLARRYGSAVPALGADVSITLTPGLSIAPGLSGIGGTSLLGTASYLPFRWLGGEAFGTDQLAIGVGGRLHLLRESFVAPGVSFSVVHHRLSTVSFGDACPAGLVDEEHGSLSGTRTAVCPGPGDIGEIGFDLRDWSTRLVASKRLLGVGATVGLGHDSYRSAVDIGFRGLPPESTSGATPLVLFSDPRLESRRWAVFGDLSYTLIFGTLAVEAGWQQGRAPISGFRNIGSDFDPRGGTWFGSLGARLAL